jgi:two-component system response regulator (stage 0 sporulation protein F)
MVSEPKIVVVEDDERLREVIAEALCEDGYAVETAANGQVALELLRHFTPDLLIIDLMMPHMNGEEFTFEVRQIESLESVPIIVVSAARSGPELSAQIGAVHYLGKPFDLFELTRRVTRLLRPAPTS